MYIYNRILQITICFSLISASTSKYQQEIENYELTGLSVVTELTEKIPPATS